MPRAKSPALKAPQTVEQATDLLARWSLLSGQAAEHAATAVAAIAATKAAASAVLTPIATEMKAIEKQVKPFWAARRDELTGGERRSIELGGCRIGDRRGNPAVKFAGGTDEEAVATLRAAELDAVLRITTNLDKPAILKAFADDIEQGGRNNLATRLRALGFTVDQADSFFIEALAAPNAVAA